MAGITLVGVAGRVAGRNPALLCNPDRRTRLAPRKSGLNFWTLASEKARCRLASETADLPSI